MTAPLGFQWEHNQLPIETQWDASTAAQIAGRNAQAAAVGGELIVVRFCFITFACTSANPKTGHVSSSRARFDRLIAGENGIRIAL
jgi:hypothetical protein